MNLYAINVAMNSKNWPLESPQCNAQTAAPRIPTSLCLPAQGVPVRMVLLDMRLHPVAVAAHAPVAIAQAAAIDSRCQSIS